MAIRHGYGKTAGTDALVFAYDTGDTRNSYKGEPTTNLIPGVANPSLSVSGWSEHGWSGAIDVDTEENAIVLTATNGWHSITYDFGVLNSPITVRFKAKLKSKQTTYIPLHVLNGRHLGDYDQSLGSISAPSLTEYQEFTATFTPTSRSLICLVLRGADTLGLTDEIYIKDLQVEQKDHATQFVNGSRSATQGLLDLTGNRSINLSNVSFDSNAEFALDATDDYVDLGSDWVVKSSGGWAVESIVKYDSVAGGYNNLISPANFIGSDSTQYNSWYWSVLNNKLALWNISPGVWKYGSTIIQPNTYYHVVLVSYDNGTQYQMYLNGVAEGGTHTEYSWNPSYSGLRVRYFGAGNSTRRFVNGEIPISKIYNRALTASEVQSNFNHYKGRFDL